MGKYYEVSCGNSIFFDPNNKQELAQKILDFKRGKYDAIAMSEQGMEINRNLYSKEKHLKKQVHIYGECLSA